MRRFIVPVRQATDSSSLYNLTEPGVRRNGVCRAASPTKVETTVRTHEKILAGGQGREQGSGLVEVDVPVRRSMRLAVDFQPKLFDAVEMFDFLTASLQGEL